MGADRVCVFFRDQHGLKKVHVHVHVLHDLTAVKYFTLSANSDPLDVKPR